MDGMISELKTEWRAAPFTPSEDEEEQYEDSTVRSLIRAADFPTLDTLYSVFLGRRISQEGSVAEALRKHPEAVAMVDHADLVYAAASKILYATCTDVYKAKVRAIGQELHEAGGMALMQCVYYTLMLAVSKMADDHSFSPITGRMISQKLEYAFDGVGDWRA